MFLFFYKEVVKWSFSISVCVASPSLDLDGSAMWALGCVWNMKVLEVDDPLWFLEPGVILSYTNWLFFSKIPLSSGSSGSCSILLHSLIWSVFKNRAEITSWCSRSFYRMFVCYDHPPNPVPQTHISWNSSVSGITCHSIQCDYTLIWCTSNLFLPRKGKLNRLS